MLILSHCQFELIDSKRIAVDEYNWRTTLLYIREVQPSLAIRVRLQVVDIVNYPELTFGSLEDLLFITALYDILRQFENFDVD